MTPKEFQEASLNTLAKHTSLDSSRWSRYFSGQRGITLDTIVNVSNQLGMTCEEFIFSFRSRRERTMKNRISKKSKNPKTLINERKTAA